MLLENKSNKMIIKTVNMGSLSYGYRNTRVLNHKNLINFIIKKNFLKMK